MYLLIKKVKLIVDCLKNILLLLTLNENRNYQNLEL